MKKSLLAVAVMAAFAGAAQAEVKLYGVVDAGITSVDNGTDKTVGLGSGIGGAPRWGIKGSEDLGNGLNAQFVLETGFDASTGSNGNNTGFSRLAYLGLNGGFGTVRLGRQNTAMKEAIGDIAPFSVAGLNNEQNYLLDDGTEARRPNQVTYLMPSFGGITGQVHYNFGEVAGDSSANRVIGLGLGYANGPLNVQFAYETVNDTDVDAGTDTDTKDAFLGATYDLGVAKVHAGYGNRNADAGAGDDFRSGLIGVSAKFGSGTVLAEYIVNENRTVDNADTNAILLGYNHALSKRTTLVARYKRTDNDAGASLGGVVAGETASAIGLGVQHKF